MANRHLDPALDSDSATSSIYKSAGHLVGISVRVNARYPSFDLCEAFALSSNSSTDAP